MDLNRTFFFWLAMALCAAPIVRALPMLLRGGPVTGWVVISAAILAAGGVAKVFLPAEAVWVVGALWAVFIAVPSRLSDVVVRHARGQRYKRAELYARIVRWLHPADGWREAPEIYRALVLAQAGQRDRAAELFTAQMDRPGAPAQIVALARVQLCRMQGRWDELLAWTDASPGGTQGPGVMLMRVRALGETGRLSDMLSAFQTASVQAAHLAHPTSWLTCQLALFAFGGRENAVTRLLEGPLSVMTPEARAFWQATARMAAGQQEAARAELRELAARSDDLEFRHAVELRLERGVGAAQEVLSPAEKAALDGFEAQANKDRALHASASASLRRAYVTNAIILLNLGAFALEMVRGGSENPRTLSRLGALWAPAILEGGQWYRLVTALFLHFGLIHVAMNLGALAIFGPWVEKNLGRARYTAVYFLSGIGSMSVVLLCIERGWMPEEVLVGASGAIMGVIGATGAVLMAGWRQERSAQAARRLLGVLLIVALQAVFDVLTPQVSFTAHAAGAVIGFLTTALLTATSLAGGRPRSIAPSPPGK